MQRPGDKYRRKRNRVLAAYLLTGFSSFLLAVAALYFDLPYGIFMTFIMIGTLCAVAFVPMVIWFLVQTMKGRQEDRQAAARQTPPPVQELTDTFGETVCCPRRPVPYPYEGRESKGPWWAVIGLMFMLPPLGLCFALYKLYQEPQNALDNAIVVRATGWVILALSVLIGAGLILLEAADGARLLMLLLLLPGLMALSAVAMLGAAAHVSRTARRLARLHSLIFMDAVLEIDDVAREMGMDYGATIRLLQTHIDRGELFSCFLDFGCRQIVAPDRLPKAATRCRHCGGTTVHIRNMPALCRYCGRVLK